MRQPFFDLAIQCTGRACVARDLLLGKIERSWVLDPAKPGTTRIAIQSGSNTLDAVLVQPTSQAALAIVLICHGIGETVQHWYSVQQLLAANGVTSLVFDYSGYGNSSGAFRARQSETDAESAFRVLERLAAPLPISLLGFSLGSGIAAAVLPRVPAKSLLLCAAFTSIRDAARGVGMFGILAYATPVIWDSAESLRSCEIPVQIVHGEKDRLFPVTMASALKAACSSRAELVIVPSVGHNEPFWRPQLSYWGPIITYLVDVSALEPDAQLTSGSC